MKKIKIIALTVIIFSLTTRVALAQNSPPYPEPPSDEQKAEWKKAGDENLRKYGSGSEPAPTAVQVKASPTISPTASPSATPTQEVEQMPELEQEQQEQAKQNQHQKRNIFARVWQWFRGLFTRITD